MALFYAIEFPNEENNKSRGPFVISGSRIKKREDAATVAVKWDVVDSFGNLKEEYYDGECLMKGTKKDCALFIDRLKANREQAEINNKEGRTRKKPTKLLDYTAVPLEEGSNSAKITERVMKKPLQGEETSYSEGKLDNVNGRNKLTVHEQNKELSAETQKFAPRNCKRSPTPVSDSEESFNGDTVSESASSDQDEYKPPKNKRKKIKNLKSTEQQPPAKKQKIVSKVKKSRNKSQKSLIEENADLQSSAIGKELSERINMKVRRFCGNESTEFQLSVHREMTLADLRKKMSSATGIEDEELRLIIRGQPCDLLSRSEKQTRYGPRMIFLVL